MIRTSDERLSLSKEINQANEKTLEYDKKKKAKKERQEQIEKHLLELMEERKTRVVAEPSLVEPHATITVRHCNLGSKHLGSRPEHYRILDLRG